MSKSSRSCVVVMQECVPICNPWFLRIPWVVMQEPTHVLNPWVGFWFKITIYCLREFSFETNQTVSNRHYVAPVGHQLNQPMNTIIHINATVSIRIITRPFIHDCGKLPYQEKVNTFYWERDSKRNRSIKQWSGREGKICWELFFPF